MVRPRLRRTKIDDLYGIQGIDTSGIAKTGVLEDSYLDRFARTMLLEDQPVAIFGASPVWPGVAQAWSYIDRDSISGNIVSGRYLFEMAKELILYAQSMMKLHRLSMAVESADAMAVKFAEHLGFSREGLMIRYGPRGEDHYLYAMVWE